MSTMWFGTGGSSAANKSKAARAEARTTSNVPAVTPPKYSGPLIDPNTGASQVNAYIAQQNAGGGTGGGTGGGGGGTVFDAAPVDAAPAMTDEEYLKADSIFQAQKNALQAALDAYLADTAAQRTTYNTNYGDSLRKLGFTGDQGALDKAKWDAAENNGQGRWEDAEGNPLNANISWNQTDKNTASGRGFENNLNDFAARGMLQSSAYQRAYNNLQRQLNEQLSSTAGARQTALGEFDRGDAAKKQEKTTAEATASQEALARIKAAYGIG